MTKKHMKYDVVESNTTASPPQISLEVSEDKGKTLYQELKSSGSIDNPDKYIKTHL